MRRMILVDNLPIKYTYFQFTGSNSPFRSLHLLPFPEKCVETVIYYVICHLGTSVIRHHSLWQSLIVQIPRFFSGNSVTNKTKVWFARTYFPIFWQRNAMRYYPISGYSFLPIKNNKVSSLDADFAGMEVLNRSWIHFASLRQEY